MHIKLKLSASLICCLLVTVYSTHAQDKATRWPPAKFPHDNNNCFHLLSNSYQCGWIYYGIKSSMEGVVVSCSSVKDVKPGTPLAYVSMIKAGNDTVRVLHLAACNHKQGDKVKVLQAREPETDVLAPLDRDYLMKEEHDGSLPQCRINEYDSRIRKTTWGNITLLTPPAPKKAAPAKKPVIVKS